MSKQLFRETIAQAAAYYRLARISKSLSARVAYQARADKALRTAWTATVWNKATGGAL
jgi:hypothetical protein